MYFVSQVSKFKIFSNPDILSVALSDSLFDRIKNSPAKQYMRNLVELNIDFTSPDPNYFSIDTSEAFLPVFNPEHGGALMDYEIDNMAKKVHITVNMIHGNFLDCISSCKLGRIPSHTISF